jgi:hypothetical protein
MSNFKGKWSETPCQKSIWIGKASQKEKAIRSQNKDEGKGN